MVSVFCCARKRQVADKPTGRLSLKSDVRLLALAFRFSQGLFTPTTLNCMTVPVSSQSTPHITDTVFRNKFENLNVDILGKQYLNVTSFVCPNGRMEQLKATRVEPKRRMK